MYLPICSSVALLEVKSMCFKFESQTHKFYLFFFILTKLKSILSTTPAFPVAPETTWETLFSVVKPKVPRFTLGSLPFLSGKSPIGGAQEATEPLGQITSTSPAPPCGILAVFFVDQGGGPHPGTLALWMQIQLRKLQGQACWRGHVNNVHVL